MVVTLVIDVEGVVAVVLPFIDVVVEEDVEDLAVVIGAGVVVVVVGTDILPPQTSHLDTVEEP